MRGNSFGSNWVLIVWVRPDSPYSDEGETVQLSSACTFVSGEGFPL